ncbi:unnamed protein product [Paramecium pentaurelia]|uniref:Uncharacterized protein n=1 Tax=Paramecium pentaurelia TaxID=43138 RepID=A0A8S1TEU9_9CILI|nr:unnamed protein product [Paramecium pentaurelia]
MNQLQYEEQRTQQEMMQQQYQQQYQQRQTYQQNQQQSYDPWDNMICDFKNHTSILNKQNNNDRQINKNQPVYNNQYPYGGQDFQMNERNNQNYQSNTPKTEIPQYQDQQKIQQQDQSNLTAYQRVFKTTPDGRTVCTYEDVKKYMESETRTEITPKNFRIKRIVEIDHKM